MDHRLFALDGFYFYFFILYIYFLNLLVTFFPQILMNASTLCFQKCTNFAGTYNCSCKPGYEGDGKYNGTGCKMTTFDTTHE